MKVLIDTSAWVDFFNGYASSQHAALAKLIAGEDEVCTCGIVVAEVFRGFGLTPAAARSSGSSAI